MVLIVRFGLQNNIQPARWCSPPPISPADELIVDYIVNSLSPMSLGEHPRFIAFFNGLAPKVNVCSWWTIKRRIADRQKCMVTKLKQAIKKDMHHSWCMERLQELLQFPRNHLSHIARWFAKTIICAGMPIVPRITHLWSHSTADIWHYEGIRNSCWENHLLRHGQRSSFVKAFKEFHLEI